MCPFCLQNVSERDCYYATQHTLNSKARFLAASLTTCWGPGHQHSALFSELAPLITVQRSRQTVPEYAYLLGSLDAAQVSSPSWRSIIGHMGPPLPGASTRLPACHVTAINPDSTEMADRVERETSLLQSAVSNDFSLSVLIYISVLACHLKGITFAISRQPADIW